MINKAWKSRLAVLAALFIIPIPARSQVIRPAPDDRTTMIRVRKQVDQPRQERRKRPDQLKDHNENPAKTQRNKGHRDNSANFRKLMQAELKHVPALDKRMDRLMTIQAERYDLQQKRQKVPMIQPGNREVTIKRFHSLLRRDLTLADETRDLVNDIVEDMPQIRKQLNERQVTLKKELSKESTTATRAQSPASNSREVRRRLRYVDFLENRLSDLANHPERLDLLARVLRGVTFDDEPEPKGVAPQESSVSTTKTKLTKLQTQRKTLQRELRQVDKKIKELRDDERVRDEPGKSSQKHNI